MPALIVTLARARYQATYEGLLATGCVEKILPVVILELAGSAFV